MQPGPSRSRLPLAQPAARREAGAAELHPSTKESRNDRHRQLHQRSRRAPTRAASPPHHAGRPGLVPLGGAASTRRLTSAPTPEGPSSGRRGSRDAAGTPYLSVTLDHPRFNRPDHRRPVPHRRATAERHAATPAWPRPLQLRAHLHSPQATGPPSPEPSKKHGMSMADAPLNHLVGV